MTAPDPRADEEALGRFARALFEVLEADVPSWVERQVTAVADAWEPGLASRLAAPAREAGRLAWDDVSPRLRELLETDVDRQRTGPLDLLRGAVVRPTSVLVEAGVPPVERDDFSRRAFPDDLYDLAPASFADISERAGELGITWGAAKAHVVLARRRAEGLR